MGFGPSLRLSEKIARAGGRTTGFDYLRIGLALSIILWHTIPISYGTPVEIRAWRGPLGLAMHFVLPMFFALSGFLVAGSLDRSRTLLAFFWLRALRILPALCVEVAVGALVLGPALTSFTWSAYLTDPHLYAYLLNVVGDIHYVLPGLFTHNPVPTIVNGQLWTIPYELQCYLVLGGLALTAALRRRAILLAIVALAQALWIWQALSLGDNGGSGGASGPVLLIAFLCGVLFHLYRDVIRLHRGIFLCVLAISAALSALPHGAYYLPVPATYITVYLGLLTPRLIWPIAKGDYSYGLFLYGYPIQQAVAAYGPRTHVWWINAAVALPLTILVAAISWHFIEKPALGARRYIAALEAGIFRIASPAPPRDGKSTDRLRLLLNTTIAFAALAGAALSINADIELAAFAIFVAFSMALLRTRVRSALQE